MGARMDSIQVTAEGDPVMPSWLVHYFELIKLVMPEGRNSKILADIHISHVNAIAYDMLDVFLGVTPAFDMDDIRRKLFSGRRGGGCSQLNGLLAEVLEALGFNVRRVLSSVVREDSASRFFTHMVLLVSADNDEWVCDAGFGYRGFLYPLRLQHNARAIQGIHEYRVQKKHDMTWCIQYKRRALWTDMYVFKEKIYEAEDFVVAQFFNSYCPLSPFKANLICAKPSLEGGSYLLNTVLVSIKGDVRAQLVIGSVDELVGVLSEYFLIKVESADFVALPAGIFDVVK